MPRLDVRLVNPALRAVVGVLKELANLDATPGTPSLKEDDTASGYITGVMTLRGSDVLGSIAITLPEPVIIGLAQRILDEKQQKIDGTVIDMLSEITNMITGRAVAAYSQQGDQVELTTPTIIIGHDHLLAHRAKGKRILLPFSSEIGEFWLEMCFEM